MEWRRILVGLNDVEAIAHVVDGLARMISLSGVSLTGVNLTGLYVSPSPHLYSIPYRAAGLTSERLREHVWDEASKAHRAFARATHRHKVAHHFLSLDESRGADTLMKRAREFDVLVSGWRKGAWAAGGLDAHATDPLFAGLGRPIVVIAPGELPDWFERVMIAWDNSREAARAVWDALPLLRSARVCDVVTVDATREGEMGDLDSAARLSVSLRRQGIEATVRSVASNGRIADTLSEVAQDYDALVMGANHRSTHRRILFGGATARMLADLPITTLLSN